MGRKRKQTDLSQLYSKEKLGIRIGEEGVLERAEIVKILESKKTGAVQGTENRPCLS